jgi:aminoglycoside phosphotransferase family enzyme/predicted kinase
MPAVASRACSILGAEVKIDGELGLAEWLTMVEQLRHAPEWSALGGGPVEMTQTHISVVLLGRERVLKLKKPVDFGFLDYTTSEKRRRACEAEVELNRRLCDQTYLGVQPIVEKDGAPRLSDAGRPIDHAVLMRRLPADRMLDEMVRRGSVTEQIIDRVAERLGRFHRTAVRGSAVEAWGAWRAIRANWEENFAQTRPFIGRTISAAAYQTVERWVGARLRGDRALFDGRVREGHVVDGHGDVRCESVCVTDGICIFDCIEFSDRFRCGDVASEVAFLGMDLDSRGRPDLGYYFAEGYAAKAGDAGLFRLLPFYRCYRAWVRGKVLSLTLDEAEIGGAEKKTAAEWAAAYFDLAYRCATPLHGPTLIVVMGLAGTGKTSLARSVAGELGFRVVSTDAVRQELFGSEKGAATYGEGAYSAEATRKTYEAQRLQGGALLASEGGAVLDGTFLREEDREPVRVLARQAGAALRWIECDLPAELVRERMRGRSERGDSLSDATWEIHLRQREERDAHPRPNLQSYLLVDMRQELARSARRATDWLREIEREEG